MPTAQTTRIIGKRHERGDGRACGCGCYSVVGLPGDIVQDRDTPKLAALGLCYVAYAVPGEDDGPPRTVTIAYTLREISHAR
jgi:hypothetical protein